MLKGELRIHWLASGTNKSVIETFLHEELKSANLKIISVFGERFQVNGVNHMLNGVFRVRIEYDLDQHDKILNLIGLNEINDDKCLIQLCGYPPKCLRCGEFGHYAKY